MIQSMTGYGKSTATYKQKKINVEIRSLNGKSIDISTRIASLYREMEIEIRKHLTKVLKRGNIDLSIWIEKDPISDVTLLNGALIENYYHQIKKISSQYAIPEPSNWFGILLSLPNVTTQTDADVLEEEEWNVVQNAIDQAVDQVVEFRKQEGIALQKKFEEKIDNIANLLQSLEPLEKERILNIRKQILEGLQQIPESDYNKNRLEEEMIYYIQKLDINEEKQRLANHLKYFRETMNEACPVGKKLGFIAQEMGREINTTGSKSNQAEMQNIVVKMKDELDQIKEQVLNTL